MTDKREFEPLQVVSFVTSQNDSATGILIKETVSEPVEERQWAILYIRGDRVEYDELVAESWLSKSQTKIVWDDAWKLRQRLHEHLRGNFPPPEYPDEE